MILTWSEKSKKIYGRFPINHETLEARNVLVGASKERKGHLNFSDTSSSIIRTSMLG